MSLRPLLCGLLMLWSGVTGFAQDDRSETPARFSDSEREEKLAERDRLWKQSLQLAIAGKTAEAIPIGKQVLDFERKLFGDVREELTDVLHQLTSWCLQEADTDQAQRYAKQMLTVSETVSGKDSWQTVSAKFLLDYVERLGAIPPKQLRTMLQIESEYGEFRRKEKPIEAIERAKTLNDIELEVLGRDHPFRANTLQLIANQYRVARDYANAEQFYLETLKIRQKSLGEEHVETAATLSSLGALLAAKKDYADARPYLEQALKIRRKTLGNDHLAVASSLFLLGYALKSLGDLAGARSCYEEELSIRKNAIGDENIGLVTTLNLLAYLLEEMQEYATARTYFEQSLTIRKKSLGDGHTDTSNSLNDVGRLLTRMKDYKVAQTYFEQGLAIRLKTLGEEHADSVTSLNRLGHLFFVQADYAGAQPYFERILKIRRKVLGEEHADTAIAYSNLANTLYENNDLPGARQNFVAALKIRRTVLGEEHVDTAITHNRLGVVLMRQQEVASARSHLELAVSIRQKKLGEKHAATAESQKNLDALLANQPKEAANPSTMLVANGNKDAVSLAPTFANALADFGKKQAVIQRMTPAQSVAQESITHFQDAEKAATLLLDLANALMQQKQNKIANDPKAAGVLKKVEAFRQFCRQRIASLQLAPHKPKNTYEQLSSWLNPEIVDFLQLPAIADLNAKFDRRDQIAQLKIRIELLERYIPKPVYFLRVIADRVDVGEDQEAASDYLLAVEQQIAFAKSRLSDNPPMKALSADELKALSEADELMSSVIGLLFGKREFVPDIVKALAIRKQILGEDHSETRIPKLALAKFFTENGDYPSARLYVKDELMFCRRCFGNGHSSTATSHLMLGLLLQHQGNYVDGIRHIKQALTIRRNVFGNVHRETLHVLNILGRRMVTNAELLPEAVTYLNESCAIAREVYGDESPEAADSFEILGYVLEELGEDAKARGFYEKALKIRRAAVRSEKKVETASILQSLGNVISRLDDEAAARSCFDQAMSIYKTTEGEDFAAKAALLFNIGRFEARYKRWQAAADAFDASRRLERTQLARNLQVMSDREQHAYLGRNYHTNFERSLSFGVHNRNGPDFRSISASWLLNGKGLIQEALAERALLTRDVQNPKFAASVQELLETRRKLSGLTLSATQPGKVTAQREMLEQLTAQEERLSRQLTEANGRTARTNPWIELADVRQSLTANGVLIDIARFRLFNFQSRGTEEPFQPAHYAAWIIPATGAGDVQIVDLGLAATIDAAVAAVRESIESAEKKDGVLQQQGELIAEQQVRDDLRRLADLVWKPLADKVGDAKRLVISPDALLWLVPWGALPIGNDKLLIEQYVLEHVVSGRNIVAAAQPRDHSRQNPPVIFANPFFDMTAADVQQQNQAILGKAAISVDDTAQRSLTQLGKSALPKASPLPRTQDEAQAITAPLKTLSGTDPQIYVGQYALESVVKAVHRPKVVTLSTHGFFLPDQEVKHDDDRLASTEVRALPITVDGQRLENPLLRCGLLFSGCNNSSSTSADDGVLTGLEIVGLDLR